MKKLFSSLLLAFMTFCANAQIPVTVSGIVVDTVKIFDANDTASVINPGTLIGVQPTHQLSLITEAHYDTSCAGTGKTITITSTIHGADSALYVLSNPDSVVYGTILRRQLYRDSVIPTPVKIYDGSRTCILLFSGIARNYVTHHILTTIDSCLFDDPDVGTNKPVRIYFGLNGEDEDNYIPPRDTTLYATIIPRKLVTKNTSFEKSKLYDGTTNARVLSRGWFTNVLDIDTVYFNLSAAYDDKNVGTYKIIHTHFDIYGPDTVNYSAPDDGVILDGVITPIQLSAEGGEAAKSKTYDGTTSCQVTSPSQPVGVLDGEQVYLNTMASYDTAAVGRNHVITFSYTIYGNDAQNYLAPADSIYCTDGVIEEVVTALDDLRTVASIGPNPFTDQVTVRCLSDGVHHVIIYNVSGQILCSQSFSGLSHRMDLSAFASGLYLFVIDGQPVKLIRK